MRPLTWPDNMMATQMQPLNSDPGVQASNLNIDKIPKVPTLPTIMEVKKDDPSCCNRSLLELKAEGNPRSRLNSEPDVGKLRARKLSHPGSVKASKENLVMQRKDTFYTGSIQNLKEFQSQKSINAFRQSMVSLDKVNNARHEEPDTQNKSSLFDTSLFKDPVFMCLAISNLFGMGALFVPFFYIVDAATKDGISNADSLISIIGATNIFGRIAAGWIADLPSVNSLFLNNICLVLCGVAVIALSVCHTFVTYTIAAVVFGIGLGNFFLSKKKRR